MSIPFQGFVGPSYTSQSIIADNQICEGWYPEQIESGDGKTHWVLSPMPGTKVFSSLAGMGAVREHFIFGSRVFAVADKKTEPSSQQLFEVFSDGSNVQRGTLGAIGARPSFAVNSANQMLVASGGRLFLLNLPDNAFSEIDTTSANLIQGQVSRIGFSDGYFIALLAGTPKFQISALEDATTWDPIDVAQISKYPDNVLASIIDHSEILLAGPKQSMAYYDSGNPDFPFEPIPGAFIEGGIVAPESLTKLDNTTFWIGGDERGSGVGFRLQGYTPTRITNHAIEHAWQGYSTISDAIGYAYQDRGHTFWHLYFPTAKKSWRYDVATNGWCEPNSNDGTAHKSQCHVMAFGKHLVGDPFSGNIYEMSLAYADENGQPLKRLRRSPHVSDQNRYLYYARFTLDVEVGTGAVGAPLLDGQGNPRPPQIMLRLSRDGGKTWPYEQWRSIGNLGEYKARVIWWRLGRARDMIFEVSITDAAQCRILGAYLDVE